MTEKAAAAFESLDNGDVATTSNRLVQRTQVSDFLYPMKAVFDSGFHSPHQCQTSCGFLFRDRPQDVLAYGLPNPLRHALDPRLHLLVAFAKLSLPDRLIPQVVPRLLLSRIV